MGEAIRLSEILRSLHSKIMAGDVDAHKAMSKFLTELETKEIEAGKTDINGVTLNK